MTTPPITVLTQPGDPCCGTCAHWQEDPVHLEGECRRLKVFPGVEDPLLRPMSPGGQPLRTAPTFGCLLWQELKGEEND